MTMPALGGYQQRVAQYLVSPLGQSTPDSVATKLLKLSPGSIGMPDEPSIARLHATRAMFEAWEFEDANTEERAR